MNIPNTTASSQRTAILKHLQLHGSLTTLYAREQLGIMSPAARILELRKKDYPIVTHRTITEDTAGTKHREAKYVLFNNTKKEAPNSDQTERDLDNATQ